MLLKGFSNKEIQSFRARGAQRLKIFDLRWVFQAFQTGIRNKEVQRFRARWAQCIRIIDFR